MSGWTFGHPCIFTTTFPAYHGRIYSLEDPAVWHRVRLRTLLATRNTSPCAVLRQRPLQEGLPEALRQALRYCLVLEGHPSKGLLCQPQNAITGLFLLEFLSMSFLNLLFVFLVMIGFLCDHRSLPHQRHATLYDLGAIMHP